MYLKKISFLIVGAFVSLYVRDIHASSSQDYCYEKKACGSTFFPLTYQNNRSFYKGRPIEKWVAQAVKEGCDTLPWILPFIPKRMVLIGIKEEGFSSRRYLYCDSFILKEMYHHSLEMNASEHVLIKELYPLVQSHEKPMLLISGRKWYSLVHSINKWVQRQSEKDERAASPFPLSHPRRWEIVTSTPPSYEEGVHEQQGRYTYVISRELFSYISSGLQNMLSKETDDQWILFFVVDVLHVALYLKALYEAGGIASPVMRAKKDLAYAASPLSAASSASIENEEEEYESPEEGEDAADSVREYCREKRWGYILYEAKPHFVTLLASVDKAQSAASQKESLLTSLAFYIRALHAESDLLPAGTFWQGCIL